MESQALNKKEIPEKIADFKITEMKEIIKGRTQPKVQLLLFFWTSNLWTYSSISSRTRFPFYFLELINRNK